MQVKVIKFGGSSLADAEHFRKVAEIIHEDPARRYVVPSAPGKRTKDDTKVTDMLYACFEKAMRGEEFDADFDKIIERYEAIIADLGLSLDMTKEYERIKGAFMHQPGRDYAASRGEYLNGMILANFLGFDFIDAATVIYFQDNGTFDADRTNVTLSAILRNHKQAVIPGFYGSMPNGTIKTFSRGGSDVTGALAAAALDAVSAQITEWDENTVYQLLEKVTVMEGFKIRVTFRNGQEIEQSIDQPKRRKRI